MSYHHWLSVVNKLHRSPWVKTGLSACIQRVRPAPWQFSTPCHCVHALSLDTFSGCDVKFTCNPSSRQLKCLLWCIHEVYTRHVGHRRSLNATTKARPPTYPSIPAISYQISRKVICVNIYVCVSVSKNP